MTTTTIATPDFVRTRAPHGTSFLIAHPNPRRWEGTFAEQLGLEPRVVPAPTPGSSDGKKASRLSLIWSSAHSWLHETPADVALRAARDASAKTFNRDSRKPTITLAHIPEDLFDPGAKMMRALERASDALFDRAADGTFPNVRLIEEIGNDLIAFHQAHSNLNDVRFSPIRSMGNCLQALARTLRDAG